MLWSLFHCARQCCPLLSDALLSADFNCFLIERGFNLEPFSAVREYWYMLARPERVRWCYYSQCRSAVSKLRNQEYRGRLSCEALSQQFFPEVSLPLLTTQWKSRREIQSQPSPSRFSFSQDSFLLTVNNLVFCKQDKHSVFLDLFHTFPLLSCLTWFDDYQDEVWRREEMSYHGDLAGEFLPLVI